ncbi:MAG: hypothetical protein ACRD96_11335, partial [Bryobacteraceae bacterium]
MGVAACAAFFYPVYWVAVFVARALPALAAAALAGETLAWFHVTPLFVEVGARPRAGVTALVTGLAIAAAWALLRKRPAIAELALASLGHAASVTPLMM